MGQFANPAWVKFFSLDYCNCLDVIEFIFNLWHINWFNELIKQRLTGKVGLCFHKLRVRNGRIGKMKYKEERLSRDRLFKCRKNCEHTRNQRRSSGHFENGFSRRTLSKGATLLLFQEKKHQLNWS